MKKPEDVLVSEVQRYLSCGVIPHPELYFQFLCRLNTMAQKHQINMLPTVLLEYYQLRVERNIKRIVEEKLKKVA